MAIGTSYVAFLYLSQHSSKRLGWILYVELLRSTYMVEVHTYRRQFDTTIFARPILSKSNYFLIVGCFPPPPYLHQHLAARTSSGIDGMTTTTRHSANHPEIVPHPLLCCQGATRYATALVKGMPSSCSNLTDSANQRGTRNLPRFHHHWKSSSTMNVSAQSSSALTGRPAIWTSLTIVT